MADAADAIALGLMSGTSMDGIDAAILTTDGERVASTGPWATYPYESGLRAELAAVVADPEHADPAMLDRLERALTDANAAAVAALLRDNDLSSPDIDIVGFHGQTVLHRPDRRLTRQLGDGHRLAQAIGIDVVNDFRSADVAAGGQGAPFAPLYHRALAQALERPLAIINIGGVANVTYIGPGGPDDILAFDTGPGNAMLDDWVAGHSRQSFDEDGRMAAAGTTDESALANLLAHDYFDLAPPKSLDRNDFSANGLTGLSPADGAATLTAFTAAAIARCQVHLPSPPKRWLVCGGGRHNATLMAGLADRLEAPVVPVEQVGWQGDALEAQAFGFLAVRSLRGLPLSLPGTTGVPRPMPGGRLHRPPLPPGRNAGE